MCGSSAERHECVTVCPFKGEADHSQGRISRLSCRQITAHSKLPLSISHGTQLNPAQISPSGQQFKKFPKKIASINQRGGKQVHRWDRKLSEPEVEKLHSKQFEKIRQYQM